MDPLVRLAAEASQRRGDVHVGGRQDTGNVEQPQQAGGVLGQPHVAGVSRLFPQHLGGGGHLCPLSAAPTSSRWESAPTNVADGAQPKTPHGEPSTSGVVAPHIPRTNRYSTPPR